MKLHRKISPAAAVCLLLLVYAAQALVAMLRDSSVADEHPHILSGLLHWTSGQFSGGLDNPPLGQLLIAAPFHAFNLEYLFPSDQYLWVARLPVLLLALVLVTVIALWASRAWNAWTACAVVFCFCLEPNVLAHGHYATLDLPLTTFWWITLWFWRTYLIQESSMASRRSRLRSAAFFALFLSVSALVKFTGLVLAPLCLALALIVLRGWGQRLRAAAAILAALVILVLLSHLSYGFESTRFGLPTQLVEAMQGKWTHRGEGHFSFLAGKRSLSGFPEYYLVTLLLKTPLPLLLLAALGSVCAWARLSRIDRSLFVLPGLVLLVLFSWIGVNIGVRHILPLYPGIVFFAAIGMQQLLLRGRLWRAALLVLVLFWGVGFARGTPQYIAYFNVLAGGAAGGHRWLLDSNLDWGQDDERLADFLQQAAARGEHWDVNPPGNQPRLGRLAVNANVLHNMLRQDERPFAWLRPMRPQGFAGYSWRLYDLQMRDYAERARAAPDDVEAQVAYAAVLTEAGQRPRAQNVLAEAAERSQDDPRLAHAAALEALDRGDLDAAAAWVRRGLRRQADDVPLQLLRARLSIESERLAARDRLESARAELALGLWWAEQREVEKAMPHLDAAARALPADLEAQRARGIALARLGRFESALAVFEQEGVADALGAESAACRRLVVAEAALASAAVERRGMAEELLLDLAQVHYEDQRYDRAAAALVQILIQNPGNSSALALLSEMQVRSKLRVVEAQLTPRPVLREDRR